MQAIPEAVASLISGSLAGAIGVGVAFPFDTLKTKQIVLSQQREEELLLAGTSRSKQPSLPSNFVASTVYSGPSTLFDATDQIKYSKVNTNPGMLEVICHVLQKEGIHGFYSGIRMIMLSQAFIKALAFAANESCHSWLLSGDNTYLHLSSTQNLLFAACFAGFVTSFVVTPVERLKVVMQASPSDYYKNEADVLDRILRKDRWEGLLTRGLGATIAREVPSYGLFFSIYGSLMGTYEASLLGPVFAPLLFGAVSGIGSRVPVYPFDVVKTLVQNSEGGDEGQSTSAFDTAVQLYKEGGITAFFDGVESKIIRAAVNHAVTFLVYNWAFHMLTSFQ